MGTIIERKRSTKGVRYTAQIRIKRGGRIIHQETQTFSKRDKAVTWIENREKELDKPGGLEAAIKAPIVSLDEKIGEVFKLTTDWDCAIYDPFPERTSIDG